MLRGFVHVNCQAQIPNSPTKSQKVHATNYSQVDFSKGQHPGETISVWAGPNHVYKDIGGNFNNFCQAHGQLSRYVPESQKIQSISARYSLKIPQKVEKKDVTLLLQLYPPTNDFGRC